MTVPEPLVSRFEALIQTDFTLLRVRTRKFRRLNSWASSLKLHVHRSCLTRDTATLSLQPNPALQ